MRACLHFHRILILPLAVACAPALPADSSPSPSPGAHGLTAEQVRKVGGQNAWEVLRRAGLNITLSETADGFPVAAGRARGMDRRQAVVLLDGIAMPDVGGLRLIPASMIASIRVSDSPADIPASASFTPGGGIVIIVTTFSR